MKRKYIVLLSLLTILFASARAQEYNQAYVDSLIDARVQSQIAKNSKFLLTGYMSTGVQFNKEESSFGASFSPILLWKPHQKFFVEAELETELEGDETAINLEYIDASYFVNKYLTIRAGKFLSPFGIFIDRLHPEWINKFPGVPLGFNHDESPVGPPSEIGVDLRGGVPLGSAKMNYSFYVVNGAQLVTDADVSENGQLMYGSAEDNNKNKSLGGRIGLLPLSNSSLEIGGSFQTGKVGEKESDYENVKAQQYALDLTYVQDFDFVKGIFDLKAQQNWVNVDNADYLNPEDSSTYTFSNKRDAKFIQAAYRPTMATNKFLKKTELVFRYSALNAPDIDGGKNEKIKTTQYTYGINYWYNWRTVLKLAYQSQKDNNAFYIQLAVGF